MGESSEYYLDYLLYGNDEEDTYDLEEQLVRERDPKAPKGPQCRYCGKLGLKWHQFPNMMWRLVETEDNIVHKCDEYGKSFTK